MPATAYRRRHQKLRERHGADRCGQRCGMAARGGRGAVPAGLPGSLGGGATGRQPAYGQEAPARESGRARAVAVEGGKPDVVNRHRHHPDHRGLPLPGPAWPRDGAGRPEAGHGAHDDGLALFGTQMLHARFLGRRRIIGRAIRAARCRRGPDRHDAGRGAGGDAGRQHRAVRHRPIAAVRLPRGIAVRTGRFLRAAFVPRGTARLH